MKTRTCEFSDGLGEDAVMPWLPLRRGGDGMEKDMGKNKKLIFLDCDGTLTPMGGVVPPESAVRAIRTARENGHKVFLCSGRNYTMLTPLLGYGFDGAAASGGGHIVCDGEVIYDKPMSEEQLKTIISVFKRNDVSYAVETIDYVYGDERFRRIFGEYWMSNVADAAEGAPGVDSEEALKLMNLHPIEEYDKRAVYKVIFLCMEDSCLDEPRRVLSGKFHFCMQSLPVPGTFNGELINRSFNKGQAVLRVCGHLGVPVSDTIGFGDSPNDVELIETVGTSVCMGNGCDELKAISDMVCPAVEEDGLARAFEELGLV